MPLLHSWNLRWGFFETIHRALHRKPHPIYWSRISATTFSWFEWMRSIWGQNFRFVATILYRNRISSQFRKPCRVDGLLRPSIYGSTSASHWPCFCPKSVEMCMRHNLRRTGPTRWMVFGSRPANGCNRNKISIPRLIWFLSIPFRRHKSHHWVWLLWLQCRGKVHSLHISVASGMYRKHGLFVVKLVSPVEGLQLDLLSPKPHSNRCLNCRTVLRRWLLQRSPCRRCPPDAKHLRVIYQ